MPRVPRLLPAPLQSPRGIGLVYPAFNCNGAVVPAPSAHVLLLWPGAVRGVPAPLFPSWLSDPRGSVTQLGPGQAWLDHQWSECSE